MLLANNLISSACWSSQLVASALQHERVAKQAADNKNISGERDFCAVPGEEKNFLFNIKSQTCITFLIHIFGGIYNENDSLLCDIVIIT